MPRTAFALAALAAILAAGSAWAAEPAKIATPENLATLDKECMAGNAFACGALGDLYKEGKELDADQVRSAMYYMRSCAEGPPAIFGACRNAGMMMALARQSFDRQLTMALNALVASCDGGTMRDCNVIGMVNMVGAEPTIVKDERHAVELFERACAANVGSACGNLGDAHASGKGTSKNPAQAAALYQKACLADYMIACLDAGVMLATGEGVPKNLVAAVKMFKRACDHRVGQGCQGLVAIYRQDEEKARAAFKEACGDDKEQCGHFDALIEGIQAGRALKSR